MKEKIAIGEMNRMLAICPGWGRAGGWSAALLFYKQWPLPAPKTIVPAELNSGPREVFGSDLGKLAKPSNQTLLVRILGIRNQSFTVLRLSHSSGW
jgi:hypothetical protein